MLLIVTQLMKLRHTKAMFSPPIQNIGLLWIPQRFLQKFHMVLVELNLLGTRIHQVAIILVLLPFEKLR